ncbi:MAG: hypothetical protein E7499_07885 [Ruminococcus sp.]|nr:hypothetical protein [Ruminococcus sp.]
MFNNNRYLTKGVQLEIPPELQIFMWECIDRMPESKDYLQVFNLEDLEGVQRISHSSEEPEYKMEYLMPSEAPITQKVYVIDDGDHSTMLLAEEY